MALCRPVLYCGCAFLFAIMRAEATAAYTAKPAVTAVLALAAYLGSCRVDSALISCAHEFYPFTLAPTFFGTYVTVAIAIVVLNRERF
jgi:hypothetical protein